MRNLSIGISFLLGFKQQFLRDRPNIKLFYAAFRRDHVFNLAQEPRINPCFFLNGLERNTQLHGIIHMKQSVPARLFNRMKQLRLIL